MIGALVALAQLVTPGPQGGPAYHALPPAPPPDVVEFGGELVPWALDLYDWGRLADCESGGDWHIQGAFSGGLQFLDSTWRAMGGVGRAGDASVAEQLERARMLLDRSGPGQWPACSRRIGWR